MLITPILAKVYPGFAPVPLPDNWKRNEVFWPIIASASAMGLSLLTKNKNLKTGMIVFGVTAIASAVVAGLGPQSASARVIPLAQQQQAYRRMIHPPVIRAAPARPNGTIQQTPTYISQKVIRA